MPSRCAAGRAVDVMPCALASCRSQELHLRPESHSYLPELGKSEMEFIESKRPRLELLPDPLLRPSPLLAAGQPGGSDDLSKVRLGPQLGAPLNVWCLLRLGCVQGNGEVCSTAWAKAGRCTEHGARRGWAGGERRVEGEVFSVCHCVTGEGQLSPKCVPPAGTTMPPVS